MSRIGAFSPSNARRVWASTLEVEKQVSEFNSPLAQRSAPVLVRNTSGHTIPPFGLMQIAQFAFVNNRPAVEVVRPYSASTLAAYVLVNSREPIENNKYGSAQQGPVFRVLASGIALGDRMGWKNDSFESGLGCLLLCIGNDDLDGIVRCVACHNQLEGTAAATISETTEGNVTIIGQSGAHKAKTHGSNISSGANVILRPGSKGKWLATEVC